MTDGAPPDVHSPSIAGRPEPTRKTIDGMPYLIPPDALVVLGEEGPEVQGEGIIHKPDRTGDRATLAVPKDTLIDQFIPTDSMRKLYHLVHTQKWEGVMVPHDTHTHAAEQDQAPYSEYVQAVTFAKVTGEMEYPLGSGKFVHCAVLNLRMPNETYGGQLWWVIGGHNVPHESRSPETGGSTTSSLGATLVKEGEEEALVLKEGDATETPFNPREKAEGRRMQVLGYGRSSDTVGKVHESAIVSVHLPKGERLVVRDLSESLGFIRVPLTEWMRFMRREATEADQAVIREAIIRGAQEELNRLDRIPESEREERQALINTQLIVFFGENRDEFHLDPQQNTPPIDRLSLSVAQKLYESWPVPSTTGS